mmetsp:Transcript_25146/g.52994  ORF Transcript_25146/g.52994 Transcript_25146/m.52994 type:complete len:124 (+) Transcript_25146:325-696(+)
MIIKNFVSSVTLTARENEAPSFDAYDPVLGCFTGFPEASQPSLDVRIPFILTRRSLTVNTPLIALHMNRKYMVQWFQLSNCVLNKGLSQPLFSCQIGRIMSANCVISAQEFQWHQRKWHINPK